MELERCARIRSGQRSPALDALAVQLVIATAATALVAHQEITLTATSAGLVQVLHRLRQHGFEQLMDVDLRADGRRTWLVHHLLSLSLNTRVRVRTPVYSLLLPAAGRVFANATGLEALASSTRDAALDRSESYWNERPQEPWHGR
jgi:NADH:ubiquinone oxidoreductase subunit C